MGWGGGEAMGGLCGVTAVCCHAVPVTRLWED